MDETRARAVITDHFASAGRDEVRASGIYADDAVLEFPQGGERIRGKANILAFRTAYPASLDFEIRRTIGCGDLWVNEYTIRYDGKPSHVVGMMEFRDDRVSARRSTSANRGIHLPGAHNGSSRWPSDPSEKGACNVAGSDPRVVAAAFLSAVNSHDTHRFDVLLHPDYQETYPQSGERTRGAANLRAILDHYPGGYDDQGLERIVGAEDRWVATPSFTLLRIEGTGNVYTGVQKARYSDGSDWFVVSIARFATNGSGLFRHSSRPPSNPHPGARHGSRS